MKIRNKMKNDKILFIYDKFVNKLRNVRKIKFLKITINDKKNQTCDMLETTFY